MEGFGLQMYRLWMTGRKRPAFTELKSLGRLQKCNIVVIGLALLWLVCWVGSRCLWGVRRLWNSMFPHLPQKTIGIFSSTKGIWEYFLLVVLGMVMDDLVFDWLAGYGVFGHWMIGHVFVNEERL